MESKNTTYWLVESKDKKADEFYTIGPHWWSVDEARRFAKNSLSGNRRKYACTVQVDVIHGLRITVDAHLQ